MTPKPRKAVSSRPHTVTTMAFTILIIALGYVKSSPSPFQKHQKPLDLNYPMEQIKHFSRLNPKFYTLKDIQMKKITDSHFRLDEEIGILGFKGQTYGIGRADFYSPSLHTISGKQMDMELHL
jgi:carbonic anhydrase